MYKNVRFSIVCNSKQTKKPANKSHFFFCELSYICMLIKRIDFKKQSAILLHVANLAVTEDLDGPLSRGMG